MNSRTSRSYHHGNLRQSLLDAAGEILESQGAGAISLRRLARELDVSHAAPAHHFSNKTELIAELAADGYRALADAMAAAMAGTAPSDWLELTGRAYIRFGVGNPQRYRLMFASGLMHEDCPQRLTDESSRAYLLLLAATYPDSPPPDPATYHMGTAELAAWSVVHGAVMLWLDGQLGVIEEADFLDLADRMLAEHIAHRART
jgi:AcrR family transcriptional regulator